MLLYTTALSPGQRPDVLDAMKELLDLIAVTASEQQARSSPSTDPA